MMNKLAELGNKRVRDLTEKDIQLLMSEGLRKIEMATDIVGYQSEPNNIDLDNICNNHNKQKEWREYIKSEPKNNSSSNNDEENSIDKIIGIDIPPKFTGILSDLFGDDHIDNLFKKVEEKEKKKEDFLNTYLRNLSGWNEISTGCLNELEKVGIFKVEDVFEKLLLLFPCAGVREKGLMSKEDTFIDFAIKRKNYLLILKDIFLEDIVSYDTIEKLGKINRSHKIEIDSLITYLSKEIEKLI